MNIRQGSIPLFRFAGIEVRLHWLWFLFAVYEIQARAGGYSSVYWNVLEYLALFLIVMIHEFGHALACRQVGGVANQIVLWPLGGVAYVNPPPRPGATLWSIAAGPLVNVVLFPILYGLYTLGRSSGWAETRPDVQSFLFAILAIDVVLFLFNMLPIYPLDGGQILRALLWFPFGRARSLLVATIIGFFGVAGLIAVAVRWRSPWFVVLSVFILLNCWGGLRQALSLSRMAKIPRRAGFACPSCKSAPFAGTYWMCGQCRRPFDPFETQAVCPHCATRYAATRCLECGAQNPISAWAGTTFAPHPLG